MATVCAIADQEAMPLRPAQGRKQRSAIGTIRLASSRDVATPEPRSVAGGASRKPQPRRRRLTRARPKCPARTQLEYPTQYLANALRISAAFPKVAPNGSLHRKCPHDSAEDLQSSCQGDIADAVFQARRRWRPSRLAKRGLPQGHLCAAPAEPAVVRHGHGSHNIGASGNAVLGVWVQIAPLESHQCLHTRASGLPFINSVRANSLGLW